MGQKKKKATQTRSFDQLVADAQIKRLEPVVKEMVSLAMAGASQAIYKFVMSQRSATMTRQLAFERLLKANTPWFNENVLAAAVADVEDESQGLVACSDATKIGDKVRGTVAMKKSDGTFGEQEKIAIHQIGVENTAGTNQTTKELEDAIVGLKAGESREVALTQETENGPETTYALFTVEKVSRAPVAEEVAQ